MLSKEDFIKKNKLIDDIIIQLKKEFVGIHKQIDEIMGVVRTWYLFPDLQTRPVVVNLWGMTGTGKTQLTKRITEMLDMEEDLIYFNFASISECTSWDIENQIEEETTTSGSKHIIVYDEFQYANTLDPSTGCEVDKRTALKPFWELLDSGTIKKKYETYVSGKVFEMISYFNRINSNTPISIVDGVWVNGFDCMKEYDQYIVRKVTNYFSYSNFNGENTEENDEKPNYFNISEKKSRFQFKEKDFFLTDNALDTLFTCYSYASKKSITAIEFYNMLSKMDDVEFLSFLIDLSTRSKKGFVMDFRQSIVFIIGNLDEAYQISFDVDPDMSPNQFREITNEMNVVDIKAALRKRFRNEQIARMGNTHIIYPSFSQKDFEDLITMKLNEFKNDAKRLIGKELVFDHSINEILYKEGVYPTHGTRPLFSTVHELVKTPLSNIIQTIMDNNIEEYDTIKYSFNYDKFCLLLTVLNKGEEILSFDMKATIRLESVRSNNDNPELQCITAVHESGHFVLYSKLTGKLPEKLISKCADSSTGGFLMEDYNNSKTKLSRNDLYDKIKILIAGHIAERIVFGRTEYTTGASDDLAKATEIASRMVRQYGMGIGRNSGIYQTTYLTTNSPDTLSGMVLREDSQNDINMQIKAIINDAETEVRRTLTSGDWYEMFKESAKYLSKHVSMPKDVMQKLYDKVSEENKKDVRDENFYRNAIDRM